MMRFLSVTTLMLLVAGLPLTAAHCDPNPRGKFEVAMLGGATVFVQGYSDSAVFGVPASASALPLASMLRLSWWVGSHATIDAGFSWLSLNAEGGSRNYLVVEGGPGVAFGKPGSAMSPFAGALVGVVRIPGKVAYFRDEEERSDTRAYLGAEIGVRSWFRDYAAIRFQAGYRRVFGNDEDWHILEVLGGIGVFF